ncbi:class I SAM-dependent methyltransferase [Pseudonocardia spinosispora]|uniref:class I SAM-dependent methyltransferase n=1 Tax=Pseudonocardia spinosispora TaxID=103441 RepID=UPI00042A412F|nr:methyltransferase domain-containing protein [Pseudonocardia spinosispora]
MRLINPTGGLPIFLAAALRRPGVVGAVAPSSHSLGQVLATVVPTRGEPTVVELGPGTGTVSRAIEQRLPSEGVHYGIEIDDAMADHLERTRPRMRVLRGDVAQLRAILGRDDVSRADAVVSGLPWSLFSADRQAELLTQIRRFLAPGAGFSTFAYRHTTPLFSAQRFREMLHTHFDEVVETRTVWRNVPPAFVYICHKPLTRANDA